MELEGEIREQVDELMREELKNLKLVSTSRIASGSPSSLLSLSPLTHRLLREIKVKGRRGKGRRARKERKG